MTRGSILEYAEAVRGRYLQATKKERERMLDEFTKDVGFHRKGAICLPRRANQPTGNKKRVRPQQYSASVAQALRVAFSAQPL